MDVPTLVFDSAKALMAGQNISLSLPKGARWPHNFPRGELLSVGTDGTRNVSFDPLSVLAWVQQTTKLMQAFSAEFVPNKRTTIGVQRAGNAKGEHHAR
jgi:hypothetical protein